MAESSEQFLDAVTSLGDEDMRRPSLLPDWSIGHLLTHVARNASSHIRRSEAAIQGEVIDQYAGGAAGRAAEIEEGSKRPAAEILADVRSTAVDLATVWDGLPLGAWTGRSRDSGGLERPLFELPARRWQEVTVHVVDLGVGITHRDWSEDFVLQWLPRTRERVWKQLPPEAEGLEFEDPRDELAWLYGRLTDGLPPVPAWG